MEERTEEMFDKEVVKLEDGRYLIYYTFESEENPSAKEISTSSPRKGEA